MNPDKYASDIANSAQVSKVFINVLIMDDLQNFEESI